jgi:hypothetical protein
LLEKEEKFQGLIVAYSRSAGEWGPKPYYPVMVCMEPGCVSKTIEMIKKYLIEISTDSWKTSVSRKSLFMLFAMASSGGDDILERGQVI